MLEPYLWVGIGFQKGADAFVIDKAIALVFEKYNLPQEAIAGLATADFKETDESLKEVLRRRNWGCLIFSKEDLASVKVPNPEKKVKNSVGVNSVAEASALLAASATQLLVPKQIVKVKENLKAVTVAIASLGS